MLSSALGVIGTGAPGSNTSSRPVASSASSALPAAAAPHAVPTSPHPGTLEVYEVAPGGGFTLTVDPAIAYDTVNSEVDQNIYQQLIGLNGSSTSTFVPELSTCVPGAGCQSMYGSSLITYNDSTGTPIPATYTFPIDSAANFFDPATSASWGVYPSDVMFSFARAMAWSYAYGLYPGWIQAQSLLPHTGNASWYTNPTYGAGVFDYASIHTNTSPEWIMSSMLVNDSAFCPSAAMTSAHGCITFVVGRDGFGGYGVASAGAVAYPFFLQTLTSDGASFVVPQGWFTAQGATVPGFPGTSAPNGDGPGLLPGNTTTTSSTAFQTYLATGATPSAWYSYATLAVSPGPPYFGGQGPNPNVQWKEVGSGPYALAAPVNTEIGYVLEANPAYRQPTGCVGQPNCQPPAGSYEPNVHVYWEASDATGQAQLEAGQADLAGIQLPAHVSTFDTLASAGLMNYWAVPSISIFFQNLALLFNVSAVNTLSGSAGVTN
ncbi:hypothetical protein B1B_10793, partial [mine drainage metagenome]